MPVNYVEDEQAEELGTAGFLKVERTESGYRGAFFVINARGEPVEFTYTRLSVPDSFLWRKADIARHAIRKMAGSLFDLCPASPRLVFCLSGEVDIASFVSDLKLTVPLCGVAPSKPSDGNPAPERGGESHPEASVRLAWIPAWPGEGSTEHKLFSRLLSGGLILEPFERAAAGLREVYQGQT